MRRTTPFMPLFLCMIGLLVSRSAVQAFPPFPSSFYGSVKVNGSNLADGTLVQAIIGDQVVAYTHSITYQSISVYALDVPGDDPSTARVEGGTDGAVIQFIVGGMLADQTGTWRSGTNIELDLTVNMASTPEPPAPNSPIPLAAEISTEGIANPTVSTTDRPFFPTETVTNINKHTAAGTSSDLETDQGLDATSTDPDLASLGLEYQKKPDTENTLSSLSLAGIISSMIALGLLSLFMVLMKMNRNKSTR